MMNEHDDSLNTEHTETHAEGEHICTDGNMCAVDRSEAHIIPSESTVVPTKGTKMKKIPMRLLGLGIVGLIVLVIAGLSGFVYTHASSDKNVQAITQSVPFPAYMIGRSFITYGQYYEEREALTKYFDSQAGTPKPTEDEFNLLITDTLVNKAIVKKLASNYGVILDQTKVEEFYQNILKSAPSEDEFKKQLQETFGWSIPDFKRRIIESVVLAQQVNDYIVANKTLQQPKQDLINQANARIVGGEDFAKVADEIHLQVQVTMKSDLGLIKKSDLPPEWAEKVKNLEKGKISEVIELPQGYAIFMATDVVGKDADEQIHLLAMTVPKLSLQTVIAEYLKNVQVKKLIKI